MLSKDELKNSYEEMLDRNFERRAKYFKKKNYEHFIELNSLVFEINKCIIFGMYRAAITLTNLYLERLLKIALIYNQTGIGPIDINNWNEVFNEPTEKFTGKELSHNIDHCKKEGLIDQNEKEYLFNEIREMVRNGFSHADAGKILKDVPNQNTVFHAHLSDPSVLQAVDLNHKNIPIFQDLMISDFARINAEPYFDSIYNLSLRIEKRLKEKHEKKL